MIRPTLILLTVSLSVGTLATTASPAVSRRGDPARGALAPAPSVAPAGRYFVVLDAPPAIGRAPTPSASDVSAIRAAQAPALAAVTRVGGRVGYRYTRLLNGFSTTLPAGAADALATRPDVARVTPVGLIRRATDTSVPFIGARRTWKRLGLKGKGIRVAVVDTGVDYTHAALGGPGTRAAYNDNDPTEIEPGSFPTKKVIDGYDFVGENYDVDDNSKANDTPEPDRDPLDGQGHGSHVAGICCGKGVRGELGKGVAFKAKIIAYKVWAENTSTSDVLVAAFERAVDPDRDGDLSDAADVISFSGSVTYGSPDSVESVAAQSAVEAGVVVVAAAGNAGGQFSSGGAYRVGAPAVAPGVIGVAASQDHSDGVALFSSEGPARGSDALKPDITAPGEGITSVDVGTGHGTTRMSGTSMAAPHVSGAAALLLQAHPRWSPAKVKAGLLNHARARVKDGGKVVQATVMGAGRIRIDRSAGAGSLALPGSVSFGLRYLEGKETVTARLRVMNNDKVRHRYAVRAGVAHSGVGDEVARPRVSRDGETWRRGIAFSLGRHKKQVVHLRIRLDGNSISQERQLDGWYATHRNIDGAVVVRQSRRGRDKLRVPWHVVPIAASDMDGARSSVDFNRGRGSVALEGGASAGRASVDAYILGGKDETGDTIVGEADITHFGVRSFAGRSIGDGPRGLPDKEDVHSGLRWKQFVTAHDKISEPVEFLIRTERTHATTDTMEVSVAIDTGADGVFASDRYKADYVATKLPFTEGTCVYDMSLDRPFRTCKETYLSDYSRYNSSLTGIVVDARAIGIRKKRSRLSYSVVACSDLFSGDVPLPVCDDAGAMRGGTHRAKVDVTAPPVKLNRWFCGGFWSDVGCAMGFEAKPGSKFGRDRLLLAFPNNDAERNVAVVSANP
ncbi:MAG: S8 family serine peptidase [Actinomycetota bacterium]